MELENNLKLNPEEINKKDKQVDESSVLKHIHSSNYVGDIRLINKIFSLGWDPRKEFFARAIVSKIEYSDLYNLDKGETIEVDVNSIFPCQSIINQTHLIELMIYLRDNEVPGYPIGIKVGDEVYLLDGHHRVSAQILMGKKTVMMHLTSFKEDDEIVEAVRNLKPEIKV